MISAAVILGSGPSAARQDRDKASKTNGSSTGISSLGPYYAIVLSGVPYFVLHFAQGSVGRRLCYCKHVYTCNRLVTSLMAIFHQSTSSFAVSGLPTIRELIATSPFQRTAVPKSAQTHAP